MPLTPIQTASSWLLRSEVMFRLSVIIVSYNVKRLLMDCLGSIADTCRGIEHEVIVVDNNSADGTAEALQADHPEVKLIENKKNAGFARANNQGYAVSTGGFLLLLNPDTVLKPMAVKKVLDFMERTPDCGLAGCRMVGSDGNLQITVRRFPSVTENLFQSLFLDKLFYRHNWKRAYYARKPFQIDYGVGAFMMIRREALAGQPYLLNPDFHMYAEEKDLALRLKENGWRCYFVPGAEIVHYGGQSTSQMPMAMFLELQRSQARFYYMHNRGVRANALCLSWWLVLIASFIKTLLAYFYKRDGLKIKMMWAAVREFPQYCKQAKDESGR